MDNILSKNAYFNVFWIICYPKEEIWGRIINLSNKRFGRLVVIERTNDYISPKGRHKVQWLCQCDCGNKVVVCGDSLKNKLTQSCGCLNKEMVNQRNKKYNTYDLSGEYGVGYTSKGEPFYFDLEDYDLIKDYCWRIDNKGYVIANIISNNNQTIALHKLLFPLSIYVDHKNHQRCDNRKINLRVVTPSQNCMNKIIRSDNTSGITGVSWNCKNNKWLAKITIDYKTIYLGYYGNFEDAVKARKEAEEKYFGEYSYDNSMKE